MSNAIYLAIIVFLLIILYITLREEKSSWPRAHYRVEEYWKGHDRREFRRISKMLPIDYSYESPGNAEDVQRRDKKKVVSQNVSWGGIQLLIPEKLKEGTRLSLKIHLEEDRPPIQADGEVIWTEEAQDFPQPDGSRVFRTGMKFITFSSNAQDRLIKFLYE